MKEGVLVIEILLMIFGFGIYGLGCFASGEVKWYITRRNVI